MIETKGKQGTMKHFIELMADYEGENTQTGIIQSNIDSDELDEAYKAGTVVVGFDPVKVFRKSRSWILTRKQLDRLEELGIGDVFKQADSVEDCWLDPYSFMQVFLFIAKLGNPEFEFEKVEAYTVKIGGCGLFTQA